MIDATPAVYSEPLDIFDERGPYDFTCPKCGVHFKGDKTPNVSCAVYHSKGSCCHYGYRVADEDKKP